MAVERPYTLMEVAERYRFNERKLRRIIRKHSLPVLRDGHDIRFDDDAMKELTQALRVGVISPKVQMMARLDEMLAPNNQPIDEPKMWVYFISDGTNVKIGRSVDPELRLEELQIGSSAKLKLLCTLPGGTKTERRLHRDFAKHRVRGEWFGRSEEIMDFIDRLKGRRGRS